MDLRRTDIKQQNKNVNRLLCFQKVVFCLALYTEEVNLQFFVMI